MPNKFIDSNPFLFIKEFNDYFKNLRPQTNTRNPWFLEYWQEQFNCTINRSTLKDSKLSLRECSENESLNVRQDGFIHFVIDSVFSMAHGIHNLLTTHCDSYKLNKKKLIECQLKTELGGPELLNSIRNVHFTSITGREVKFKESGDGLAPYEVFQYQKNNDGRYQYVKIAEWESDREFKIEKTRLKWRDGTNKIPK